MPFPSHRAWLASHRSAVIVWFKAKEFTSSPSLVAFHPFSRSSALSFHHHTLQRARSQAGTSYLALTLYTQTPAHAWSCGIQRSGNDTCFRCCLYLVIHSRQMFGVCFDNREATCSRVWRIGDARRWKIAALHLDQSQICTEVLSQTCNANGFAQQLFDAHALSSISLCLLSASQVSASVWVSLTAQSGRRWSVPSDAADWLRCCMHAGAFPGLSPDLCVRVFLGSAMLVCPWALMH